MPDFTPGSSEQFLSDSPVTVSAEVSEKLAALAVDEPLPEIYDGDRISLLVQSPYRIFLYWNHGRDPYETLRRAFGRRADNYRAAVRLTDLESGEESTFEASPFANNYWFNVRPGRVYQAYVGLVAPGRPFIRLLSSRLVRTPRTSVSTQVDERPEFRVPPIDFARALNEAGFTNAAVEIALEASDEATQNETTRGLAREWTHAEVVTETEDELAELRALLAAIASGVDLAELRGSLSPRLQRLLDELLASLDAARLRALLQDRLHLEIIPVEGGPQPVWGASEVHFPRRTFRIVSRAKFPSSYSLADLGGRPTSR